MKSILSIFVLFTSVVLFAQQGGWEKIHLENGIKRAHDIKPTSDGGYIMTGFSNPSNSFYGQDVMLLKINGSGDYEWSVNFDASDGSDFGYEVIQTYSGGFAIVGRASTPIHFGGDGHFLLTNAFGSLEKQEFYGGHVDGDVLNSIVQTPTDSGFVMVGMTGSTPFLVRTDKNGDTLFTKRYYDFTGVFKAVTCSEDGQFLYIAGNTASPKRGLIIKTDLQGDEIWTFVSEDAGSEELYDINETNGLLYCSGRIAEFGQIVPSEYHVRVVDAVIGSPLSIYRYGVSNTGIFQTMVWSNDNNLTLVGTKYDSTTGGSAVYVVKTDSAGNLIWEKQFGSSNNSSSLGRGICKAHDYGYVICGQYTAEDGVTYVYIIKIDENGSTVSTSSFPYLPEVQVYPNPCTEVLNLKLGNFANQKRITVFNSLGQEVYQQIVEANEHQITQVNTWQTGVYLIQIEVDGHKVVRKVVVGG